MRSQKESIDAILRILMGSKELGYTAEYPLIIGEFRSVLSASKISDRNKKFLIQVLFSTRALDTSLKTFIREKCVFLGIVDPQDYSLGAYLTWLANNPVGSSFMNEATRKKFQEDIVDKRNKYMHSAGAYPQNEIEINKLLVDMHVCLHTVMAFSK